MVPFAPAPTWRDNRRFVRIACAVWAAGTLLAAATAQRQTDEVIERARDQGTVNYTWGVGYQQGLASLWNLASLVGLALVIIATWRLVRAHQLLGRPGSNWGPGWAIAGRLIPVASGVLPALQLQELWRGSTAGLRHGDPAWKEQRRSRAVIAVLVLGVMQLAAGLILISIMFDTLFTSFEERSSDSPADVRSAMANWRNSLADSLDAVRPWAIAGAVLSVAVTALSCWVLLTIAERQQRLYEADPHLPPVAAPQWAAPVASFPPGWYPDPWGQFSSRWFDGTQWTAHGWGEPAVFTPPPPPPSPPPLR